MALCEYFVASVLSPAAVEKAGLTLLQHRACCGIGLGTESLFFGDVGQVVPLIVSVLPLK